MQDKNYKKISEYELASDPRSDDIIPSVHTGEDGARVNRNITFAQIASEAKGDTGPQGPMGPQGEQGDEGNAATIDVGVVATVPNETPADVRNTGTTSQAVFDFDIPVGETGEPGVIISDTAPLDTDVLWADTSEDAAIVFSVNGRSGEVTGLAEQGDVNIIEGELVESIQDGDAATLASANDYTDTLESELAAVAKTGEYSDLLNKPTIPSITGKADISYVNTQDAALQTSINTKVDKVTGKGLSTEDYTSAEKTKLTGVATGATANRSDAATDTLLAAKASTVYADALVPAHVAATDPHSQYHNDDRGDARYAGRPYAVMSKAKFASLASSYGMLGKVFGNSGYINDFQVFGESTQTGTPTPDVPVAIVSTSGNVTVRSDNKNLLALPTGTNATSAGITRTFNSDGSITFNGTSTGGGVTLNLATPLVLSGPMIHSVGVTIPPLCYFSLNNAAPTMLSSGETSQAFTANGTTVYTSYIMYFDPGATVTNLTVRPQIEAGSVATAYEKNQNTTSTLPLSTTQLRSLPNGVSDRIYKSGSSWFLEQNVGRDLYDGSETWILDTGFDGTYSRFRNNNRAIVNTTSTGLNNRFTNRGGSPVGAYEYLYNLPASGSVFIQILTSRLSANTVAAFKTWLASNNVESLYDPPTSSTVITDPTLITALENIRTYQGITNITASTPVSGSYGKDLTAALDGKQDFPLSNSHVPVRGSSGNQASLVYSTTATATSFVLREAAGTINTGTPTTTTHATTKAYVDTADALKVSLDGTNIMTGQLRNTTPGVVGYSHVRGGATHTWGTTGAGRYAVTSASGTVGLSLSNSGLRVGDDGAAAAQKLDVIGNARINGADYIVSTGFPNGVVSAPVGSIYIDTAVTNGASSWIKKSGTGNTGWVVFEGDTGWRNITLWDTTGTITGAALPTGVIPRSGNSGAISIMRSGDDVVWRIRGVTFTASQPGFTIPTGFGISPNFVRLPVHNGSAVMYADVGGSQLFVGTNGQSVDTSYALAIPYKTPNAWPSTLPGTAA